MAPGLGNTVRLERTDLSRLDVNGAIHARSGSEEAWRGLIELTDSEAVSHSPPADQRFSCMPNPCAPRTTPMAHVLSLLYHRVQYPVRMRARWVLSFRSSVFF